TISQKSTIHGEKQEGDDEKSPCNRDLLVPLLGSDSRLESHQRDDVLVGIVAESPLKLRGNQVPESFARVTMGHGILLFRMRGVWHHKNVSSYKFVQQKASRTTARVVG